MAEFSQRSAAIEERKTRLVGEFAAAHGRQPTSVEVLELRRRATLGDPAGQGAPQPGRDDRAGGAGGPRATSATTKCSWVAGLADRNDLPLLHAGDLADGILADAAGVAVQTVAERRATFSRANVLAEVHRQLHGVRFASPDERIAVAERTADLALAQSLLISAPELHHTPERLRRADGTSRFRAKGHEVYTTATLLEAEARLLEAGRQTGGPAVARGTVASVTAANLPGRDHPLSLDQAVAVEQIATSGRSLDVLVGPAGTGKSTTMAGLRAVWEAEHGAGSVLGPGPLGRRGRGAGRRARHRHREHGQVALRAPPGSRAAEQAGGSAPRAQVARRFGAAPLAVATAHRRRRGRSGPLAAPERPAGDRGRGHPGRHLRPRRAGHRGRRRRGQGRPGR